MLVLVGPLIGGIGAQFNPRLTHDHIKLAIGAGDVVRFYFPRLL